MTETKIQKQIENAVTNGRGYDRADKIRVPFEYRDKEIGLQIALKSMDILENPVYDNEEWGFKSRLDSMVKRFDDARISLYSITDANGFREAMSDDCLWIAGIDLKRLLNINYSPIGQDNFPIKKEYEDGRKEKDWEKLNYIIVSSRNKEDKDLREINKK